MTPSVRLVMGLTILGLPLVNSAVAVESRVTLPSLLGEMIDRDALARWPDPPYTAKEFTSYDRRSVSPTKPGWFANDDFSHFLQVEQNQGRTEYVMMDVDGPGAITCMFKATTDPDAIVRIYLDENPVPVIEENFRYFLGGGVATDQERHFAERRVPLQPADQTHFLGGFGTIKPPLATVNSLGCDLYLPIPYARHCKVTYDKPGKCYYRINYRTYAPSTPVETFTLAALKSASDLVNRVNKTLSRPAPPKDPAAKSHPPPSPVLPSGASLTAFTANGPGAVTQLAFRIGSLDPAQAFRSTVLSITFDGEAAVWCPVGDFFGGGIGPHLVRDWDFSVESDGTMRCFWVMPFRHSCQIKLLNLGGQPVTATLRGVEVSPWTWDDRSMYFHANWRQQYPIQTRKADGTMDWNYIEVRGRGVYVGDALVIHNGSTGWWGEGDEKIYVDGESFPSQFGTGTEDYYGYSRGGTPSQPFQSPFLAHPQVEGDKAVGYSAPTRLRSLDAIPFTTQLKFDLEIWHWQTTAMAYAVTTYWYAFPGATCNRAPESDEATRPLLPDASVPSP